MASLPLPCIIAVSGVSFEQEAVRSCVEGQKAVIERDLGNEFDVNACKITVGGQKIGWVPKQLAGRLVQDGNQQWQGQVSEILEGETWGVRIEIKQPIEGASTQADEKNDGLGANNPVGGEPDSHKPGESDPGDTLSGTSQASFVEHQVKTRSGRFLGVYVKEEHSKVLVRKNGVEIAYPADLVVVE